MTATPEMNASDHQIGLVDEDDRQCLTGLRLTIFLGIVTLVSFLVLLDMSILGTAIPRITTEFNALPDVGWYIGAYNLAAATLQPLSGKLYTQFSNQYTYLTFTLLFELGSLICGLAISSSMFIGGRVVAGLGAAGIFNGSFTFISSSVPLDKSPLYTGILAGFTQLGIVAGPLIGGTLDEKVSWRWCFYINLLAGGVAIALVNIPEIVEKEPSTLDLVKRVMPELDLIGFALFTPAVVMFFMALQFGSGETYAWYSTTIIGLLCGAGPIVAVQNAVAPAQILVAMAVLIFLQNFSTSVAGVVSNTIFAQTLTKSILKYAPSVSPAEALKAGSGASAVRDIVPVGHEEELGGLLRAYSVGLRNVFYLLVSPAVLATVVSFGMGWKDVGKKRVSPGEETQTSKKSSEA